jgi:hypothetical protein
LKNILLAAVVALSALPAFAEDTNYQGPIMVYMSLGQAPYRGSVSGDLKLENKGPNPLTDIHYTISGMGFSARDNCPKSLPVGQSCRIRVTFQATSGTFGSGAMSVTTSDKSYEVQLTATSANDPFNPGGPGNPGFPPRR